MVIIDSSDWRVSTWSLVEEQQKASFRGRRSRPFLRLDRDGAGNSGGGGGGQCQRRGTQGAAPGASGEANILRGCPRGPGRSGRKLRLYPSIPRRLFYAQQFRSQFFYSSNDRNLTITLLMQQISYLSGNIAMHMICRYAEKRKGPLHMCYTIHDVLILLFFRDSFNLSTKKFWVNKKTFWTSFYGIK